MSKVKELLSLCESFPPKKIIVVTAGSLYSYTKEEAVPEGMYRVIVDPDRKDVFILYPLSRPDIKYPVSAVELDLSLKNKSVIEA